MFHIIIPPPLLDPGCAHPGLRGLVPHGLPAPPSSLHQQGHREEAAAAAGPDEAELPGGEEQDPHQVGGGFSVCVSVCMFKCLHEFIIVCLCGHDDCCLYVCS